MNYQKIICWGDSLTCGARSYGCYPLYLAKTLNTRTHYLWQAINLSTNGHTARDLWFRVAQERDQFNDTFQACILIGTNDVGNRVSVDLFEEYYRQILLGLKIGGFRIVLCGEIPPIMADGHAFFPKATEDQRSMYNERIAKVVEEFPIAGLVLFPGLDRSCYEDPVHFGEKGNQCVADCFANAILSR